MTLYQQAGTSDRRSYNEATTVQKIEMRLCTGITRELGFPRNLMCPSTKEFQFLARRFRGIVKFRQYRHLHHDQTHFVQVY
jgi:hypothetical protein